MIFLLKGYWCVLTASDIETDEMLQNLNVISSGTVSVKKVLLISLKHTHFVFLQKHIIVLQTSKIKISRGKMMGWEEFGYLPSRSKFYIELLEKLCRNYKSVHHL